MFRVFGRSFSKSVQCSGSAVSEVQNNLRSFCYDKVSEDYFDKSVASFKKAKEYFESNNFSEAKAAISEALINSRKVDLTTPNSLTLNLRKFDKKITEAMDSASHEVDERTVRHAK